jgi:L-alanine-DL-glutamate epimerase-like enolase superfamily enzyme
LVWNSTTLVLVQAHAGGKVGIGYTYAAPAAARLIRDLLAETVTRIDAMAIPATCQAMVGAVRNLGRPGLASMAIAAVDAALWDLKSRLLELPLVTLLGPVRESIPVYGSGGFTSYSIKQLQSQFEHGYRREYSR